MKVDEELLEKQGQWYVDAGHWLEERKGNKIRIDRRYPHNQAEVNEGRLTDIFHGRNNLKGYLLVNVEGPVVPLGITRAIDFVMHSHVLEIRENIGFRGDRQDLVTIIREVDNG